MTVQFLLAELNAMPRGDFVAALGEVFEHSPWVAGCAWDARPFESRTALHRAMVGAVRAAGRELQVTLVCAHPDLAGRLARKRKLGAHSAQEQAAAGLDSLTDDEFARFERLNALYRRCFDFPFVICVRDHHKSAILEAFERRLFHTPEHELDEALTNIARIAELRLVGLVADPQPERAEP